MTAQGFKFCFDYTCNTIYSDKGVHILLQGANSETTNWQPQQWGDNWLIKQNITKISHQKIVFGNRSDLTIALAWSLDMIEFCIAHLTYLFWVSTTYGMVFVGPWWTNILFRCTTLNSLTISRASYSMCASTSYQTMPISKVMSCLVTVRAWLKSTFTEDSKGCLVHRFMLCNTYSDSWTRWMWIHVPSAWTTYSFLVVLSRCKLKLHSSHAQQWHSTPTAMTRQFTYAQIGQRENADFTTQGIIWWGKVSPYRKSYLLHGFSTHNFGPRSAHCLPHIYSTPRTFCCPFR